MVDFNRLDFILDAAHRNPENATSKPENAVSRKLAFPGPERVWEGHLVLIVFQGVDTYFRLGFTVTILRNVFKMNLKWISWSP